MFYTFCRFFEKLQMYFYTNFRYCIDCEYLPASRKEAQISNSMLFYIRLFLFHLCLYTFVCVCAHKIQQTAFSLSDTRIMIFARIHDGISQSKSLRLTVTHRQSQVLPRSVLISLVLSTLSRRTPKKKNIQLKISKKPNYWLQIEKKINKDQITLRNFRFEIIHMSILRKWFIFSNDLHLSYECGCHLDFHSHCDTFRMCFFLTYFKLLNYLFFFQWFWGFLLICCFFDDQTFFA